MRLDHLLSKEEEVEEKPAKAKHYLIIQVQRSVRRSEEKWIKISGGDAPRGHTRSHPEHDG